MTPLLAVRDLKTHFFTVDGITRVADAFSSMGDRDAARLALRMARDAAPDARTAASINERAERLERARVADAH